MSPATLSDAEALADARETIAKLREALKPLASAGLSHTVHVLCPDDHQVPARLLWGDLQRAARVLADTAPDKNAEREFAMADVGARDDRFAAGMEEAARIVTERGEEWRHGTDSTDYDMAVEAQTRMQEDEEAATTIRAAIKERGDGPGDDGWCWPKPGSQDGSWTVAPWFIEYVEEEARKTWPDYQAQWEDTQAVLLVASAFFNGRPLPPPPAAAQDPTKDEEQ